MEKLLLDNIITTLTNDSNFDGFTIQPLKLRVDAYKPFNDNEILIKGKGFRPMKYLNVDNSMDILELGRFFTSFAVWELNIISKSFDTQEAFFEITENIIAALPNVPLLDGVENINEGNLFVEQIGEPFYDETLKMYYRQLTLVKPITRYLG